MSRTSHCRRIEYQGQFAGSLGAAAQRPHMDAVGLGKKLQQRVEQVFDPLDLSRQTVGGRGSCRWVRTANQAWMPIRPARALRSSSRAAVVSASKGNPSTSTI